MAEEKLPIGTLGISLEYIDVGEIGQAYFPDLNLRAQVYAVENIHKYRDIIIAGANNQAKEHIGPVEISYETVEEVGQHVTEKYPLPTGGGYALPTSVRVTASGNTKIVEPSQGKSLRIKFIYVFNSGALSIGVYFRFTETGDAHFRANLASQTGYTLNLTGCNFRGGDDEALYINLSTTGTMDVTVMYNESN